MEVKYKNSQSEILEFYNFINSKIKVLKYYKRSVRFASIPVCLLIYIIIGVPDIIINRGLVKSDIVLILEFVGLAISWSILYSIVSSLMTNSYLKNQINNLKLDFDEEIILRVEKDGILVSRAESEIKYNWAGIKDVIENKKFVYIIVKNNISIVVPEASFEDKEAFVEAIRKNIDK